MLSHPALERGGSVLVCCQNKAATSLTIEALLIQHMALQIQFPLLLSYQGQQEAELFTDSTSLEQLLQQPQHLLPHTDRLIDAQGWVYLLDDNFQLYQSQHQLEHAEVISLVQQHFFALAQSCLVKIQAPDIRSALLLLSESP